MSVLLSLLIATTLANPSPKTVAVVIGVNRSVDPELRPLHYADDDAARYVELFESIGAQTFVMTRFDEATARLHPQVAMRAVAPVDAQLDAFVAQAARAVDAEVELFVIYAGHGNGKEAEGYLSLEDVRLPTRALDERIFSRLRARHTHFIVDACASSFLALARGAGGQRAPASGFSDAARLSEVGLILSTASARESHEWSGFQAGVFSHEIRSGLYGAADANGDGVISYRELAAFVETANASIANEKYRPDIYVRQPTDQDTVLDLKRPLANRRLIITEPLTGHHVIEDGRGVRLLDFHVAKGGRLSLIRPAGHAFLHRANDDEHEWLIAERPDVIDVSALKPRAAHVAARGGAADAFASTFEQPFTEASVATWSAPSVTASVAAPVFRTTGIALFSAAGAMLVAGAILTAVEVSERAGVNGSNSQADVASLNTRLGPMHQAWVGLFIAGGVTAIAGLTFTLLDGVTLAPTPAGVILRGAF